MLLAPMIRNNISMNAHPVGCEYQVNDQIGYVRSKGRFNCPKRVLVVGSSTGYGLASRIVAAFGSGAQTIGVFFERPGSQKRSGTAGWYNNLAFERAAEKAAVPAWSLNGDAFSNEIKDQTISIIQKHLEAVDLVVYSLAAPMRTDPDSGETYRSAIKPIGEAYSARTLDASTGGLIDIKLEAATDDEIASTVKVMGGEDWERWIVALKDANVLGKNATTVAYSYIGPLATRKMYRLGTIGKAKEHLEGTARRLRELLDKDGGRAYVSVNKALVTRASAVIPVVPLYISLLFKVMKARGLHENCIHQISRLFQDRLFSDGEVTTDIEGRIRMDDYEMREDIQAEIQKLWTKVTAENLHELADFEGYWKAFLQFHGFEVDGVDYSKEITP